VKQLIADFSAHLKQALETIQETEMVPAKRDIHNVLILGLGGSGIGEV
jgi:glucose-6-phosphate isomerase